MDEAYELITELSLLNRNMFTLEAASIVHKLFNISIMKSE